MKPHPIHLTAILLMLLLARAPATTFYVDLNSANPTPPYADWNTAATNIQDAVDTANSGDLVLVNDGIYQVGSRLASDGTQNRVVITNSIVLQSVNGPLATAIDGGKINRCVYMTNGAVLVGFTLTNGKSGNGGAVICASASEVLSNCYVLNNSAANGGGIFGGSIFNTTISGNSSGNGNNNSGGGAYGSILNNCTLSGNGGGNNSGDNGGGAYGCTLYNCRLTNNSVGSIYGSGGGACNSTLNDCIISGGSAEMGGGIAFCTASNCQISGCSAFIGGAGSYYCTLFNCTLSGNGHSTFGGGAYRGTLYNCILTGNSGYQEGGGAFQASLINCTVTGNNAEYGGGVDSCSLANCIVYSNTADVDGPNYYASKYDGPVTMNFCCTAPLPSGGSGNISSDPAFKNMASGDFHLQSNSPCINAGNNGYISGNSDFDGNPSIKGGTVDIGAYEYQTPSSVLSYAWAQQYGLPTDGSADNADNDNDGMSNYAEWKSSTNPTNALSLLQLAPLVFTNSPDGLVVTWQSVANVTYYLQRSSDLSGGFSSIHSNLVGQAGSTSYTDTTITNDGPYFYRVVVE